MSDTKRYILNTTVGDYNKGNVVTEDEISKLLNIKQCVDCGWLIPEQSKIQSQDKLQPSSIDRIEVSTLIGKEKYADPRCTDFIYSFESNSIISPGNYPAIKQAIEAVLNGDTVVEDDIVGLLRDCVSSTWGNPSLDRTQELFDKFLLDRKLVNPTLKDVNKTVTKLVNEILLDKKYSQSEVDTIRAGINELFNKITNNERKL